MTALVMTASKSRVEGIARLSQGHAPAGTAFLLNGLLAPPIFNKFGQA